MVVHKHIKVNAKKLNIPSYTVQPNDVISLTQKAEKVVESRKTAVKKDLPDWISFDEKNSEARIVSGPTLKLENQSFQFQSIIEFYSR